MSRSPHRRMVGAAIAFLLVTPACVVVAESTGTSTTTATASGLEDEVPATDETPVITRTELIPAGMNFAVARAQVKGVLAYSQMESLVAGGPGFVAVGHHGDDAAVWTSTDGRTWSMVADDRSGLDPQRVGEMKDVILGGLGFIAVGGSGDDEGQELGPAVWTSVDGVEWSRVHQEASSAGREVITAVTQGGPGFVAVGWRETGFGEIDTSVVWTSPDGVTWSRAPDEQGLFVGQFIRDVIEGQSGLVAVGSAVWNSSDGINWTRVSEAHAFYPPGTERAGMRSVIRSGPGLIAVGYGGAIWASADGIGWTLLRADDNSDPEPLGHLEDVVSNDAGLVAVASSSMGPDAGVFVSVDGVDWSEILREGADPTAIEDQDRVIQLIAHPQAMVRSDLGVIIVGSSQIAVDGSDLNGTLAAVWIIEDGGQDQ